MQIGIIGLGRMGANIARRLTRDGHDVVVFNRTPEKTRALEEEGARAAYSVDEFAGMLSPPRIAWIMVPAGSATEEMVEALTRYFVRDDIIVDGGNTFFKDDVRRAERLKARGIRYLDVGTSGGVWGLERGYCLMIGGDETAVHHLDPIFQSLAPGAGSMPRTPGRDGPLQPAERGYLHCGPSGAGHFVKMIHNGIEYGLMQAYAEGFDILRHAASESVPAEFRFELDLARIAEVWRRGSVIGSWLLDLTAAALMSDPALDGFEGIVHDSGEGRWTVMTAVEESVPADVLSAALFTRFRSQKSHTFAEKLLAAMRFQFGGHKETAGKSP